MKHFAVVFGLLFLVGCATATPYQRADNGQGGYAETRIEDNRWHISFAGNSLTDRQTVEKYMLFRAAELTLREGYDWFTTVERDTDTKTDLVAEPASRRSLFHDPYWLHWQAGYGYDPYWFSMHHRHRVTEWREVKTYKAMAEIKMHKGSHTGDDPRVFDARQVYDNLQQHIIRPQS